MTQKVEDPKISNSLAEQEYWEKYWLGLVLPVAAMKSASSPLNNEILKVFDRFVCMGVGQKVLEIGGAPGQYLVYLRKQFGCSICCLDYSRIGCEKTKENFRLLGIEGEVRQEDLFDSSTPTGDFDVVYSLGFIEHFPDPTDVVKRHLAFIRSGGLLVLGVPNLRGVYGLFLKRLAPTLLATHFLPTMDLRTWESFEKALQLNVLYKGYIGGFEPRMIRKREREDVLSTILFAVTKVLDAIFHRHFHYLRRFNSSVSSGYAMAVYRKPPQHPVK